ncbi:site-specific DNA-methyltransferase [Eikenella corrodens]|uniref:site-specific DNA-methyltransferase n=1 Tax=Eikenella corrodens TaxID=539 RepID=UPI001F045A71|nr:site-specific DNA-methyltransferase [Eikenella corrodens]
MTPADILGRRNYGNRTEPNRTEIIHDLENNFKQNNILKLKQLFPEVFCEGQIDFEKLKLVLGAENLAGVGERYQLDWAGKTAAYLNLQSPTSRTLVPCKEESADFDGTQNVFIEAENLEALKILQKSYAGSVKMIYIDPPYNTGSDSFIYPDKFSESREEYARRVGDTDDAGYLKRDGVFQGAWRKNGKDSGHYHSNWLSMMLPRLHLAKTLLREDGVIFISIDDNEQAQLKLLCDEVFGAENFVGQIVWYNASRNSDQIAIEHEYIFCYAKNSYALTRWKNTRPESTLLNTLVANAKLQGKSLDETRQILSQTIKDILERGKKEKSKKYNWISNYNNLDNDWKIYYAVDLTGEGSGPPRYFGNKLIPAPEGRHWMGQDYINELFDNNRIVWRGERAYRKLFIEETESNLKGIVDIPTRNGGESIKQLFGSQVFGKSKPANLISHLASYVSNANDLILDFFSGSGTTAHAVMQLNAEDGGSRRFICVQLPEETDEKSEARKAGFNTIAEIAKERIRRAGRQISDGLQDGSEIDTGFKVFKLAESGFKQWRQPADTDAESLQHELSLNIDSVLSETSSENLLYELMLRMGLKLTCKVSFSDDVYFVEDEDTGGLYVFLLERVDQGLIDAVLAKHPVKVAALDRLFEGNDALKSNTVLQMKDAGVVFECV